MARELMGQGEVREDGNEECLGSRYRAGLRRGRAESRKGGRVLLLKRMERQWQAPAGLSVQLFCITL